jgi:hypothetical protein
MSKLTQLHVYIIGAVLMLILGGGLFYTLIKPLDEEAVKVRGDITTTENSISETKSAQAAMKKAKQDLATNKAALRQLVGARVLPASHEIDLGDGSQDTLLKKTLSRWMALPPYVLHTVEKYGDKIAKKHHVLVLAEFSAPTPSSDPNSIPRDIIAWPMGKMTITGKFNDVMAYIRDWNNSPILTSVDGVRCSLAGKGGRIVATGALNAYIFPSGQAVSNPAGGAATATSGGMGGGYPGASGGGGGGGYPGASGGSSAGASYPGGSGGGRADSVGK